MKKILLLISGLFLLQACNNKQNNISLAEVDTYNSSNNKITEKLDNPDFIRKLQNPAKYKFSPKNTNSICGPNNLQQINSYDGKAGQSIEFVNSHKDPVGALEHGNKDSDYKFCSGTLISDNLFITASHCLDELTLSSQYVVFNYERAKNSETLLKQSHYKVKEIVEDHTNNLDYAILRLDGSPGKEFGITKISDLIPANDSKLTLIQHPSDQPKQVDVGLMVGTKGNYLLHTVDSKPGASGSGVLDENGNLTAVHTTGGCTITGGNNSGVMIAEIIKYSDTLKQIKNRSLAKK